MAGRERFGEYLSLLETVVALGILMVGALGLLLLLTILFLMFQAVFTWATVPADAIDAGFGALLLVVAAVAGEAMRRLLPRPGMPTARSSSAGRSGTKS